MDLEKFIKETLVGIRNGVIGANSEITKNGGSGSKHFSVGPLVGEKQNAITFDIAVTVSNQSKKKGGASLKVADIGFGGKLSGESKDEHISRIKFSVSPAFTIQ